MELAGRTAPRTIREPERLALNVRHRFDHGRTHCERFRELIDHRKKSKPKRRYASNGHADCNSETDQLHHQGPALWQGLVPLRRAPSPASLAPIEKVKSLLEIVFASIASK